MIALQIKDTKMFMNKLLLKDTFDHFLVSEAVVTTFNTFTVDGRLQRDFFTKEELEAPEYTDRCYSYWREIRPFCLELIKGKKTPLNFKFVFLLAPSNIRKLLEQAQLPYPADDVNGLFLNFKYNGTGVSCTTGTSLKVFTLDKSLDHSWDQMVQKFFRKQEIDFDEIG
ncbi:DUF5721 family protein [Diplocloster hominis]|uniref:DUF5721 family protein n=1 Tax=Diplocloster hominis TaxID=3079010 RepID=UPI0031BAC109